MAAAAEQLANKHEIDQTLRVRTDTVSWCAEMLNGSMRTPTFEFTADGNDLYGEDGGSLTKVFDDAIEDAMLVAETRPDLLFMVRRSLIERGELDDMLDMVHGGPNTMVVTSDYVPELMYSSDSVAGFNGQRKQTMLRVIMRRDGKIYMASQSLDGSNRQALEAMLASIGQTAEEGELLGQHKKLDLPEAWQDQLLDNLEKAYDDSLAEQFGGEWRAGIKQPEKHRRVNTYEFATQQADLIDWFVQEKLRNSKAAEKLRYELAATMTARYERRDELSFSKPLDVIRYLGATAGRLAHALMDEIVAATRWAKNTGQRFDACGVGVGPEQTTADQLSQLGYGSKEPEDQFGPLTFTCTKGHSNTRQRNQLIDNCKVCGISVSCKPKPKEKTETKKRPSIIRGLLASLGLREGLAKKPESPSAVRN